LLTHRIHRVAAAARQIAGQATLLRWIGVEPGITVVREIWLRRTRNPAACTKPVGAWLVPRSAAQQSLNLAAPFFLTHRIQCVAAAARQIAGQATLLRWIGVEPGITLVREIWLRRTQNPAACTKPVGAGLLANAVGQAKVVAEADRLREQAHSYSGSASNREIAAVPISVCGRTQKHRHTQNL
jgi:hypothetical protein